MLISARQAATILSEVGLPRSQARKVLASGLAGPPTRTTAATLYDAAQVAALTARPDADETALGRACPAGLFVARRAVDLTAPLSEQRDSLSDGWAFEPITAMCLTFHIRRGGPLPLVATIGGFVTHGAEISAVGPDGSSGYRLELTDPGPWFAHAQQRRLHTGPGRPWMLLGMTHVSLGAALGGRPFDATPTTV